MRRLPRTLAGTTRPHRPRGADDHGLTGSGEAASNSILQLQHAVGNQTVSRLMLTHPQLLRAFAGTPEPPDRRTVQHVLQDAGASHRPAVDESTSTVTEGRANKLDKSPWHHVQEKENVSRAVESITVQRQIVVGPPSKYKSQERYETWQSRVLDDFRTLLTDVAEVQLAPDGTLTITPKGNVTQSVLSQHKGFALLDRMIRSAHTVTIVPDGIEPLATVAEGDLGAASTPGQGSGAKISFPLKFEHKPFAVRDRGSGSVSAEEVPPTSILLGHELVHGDHAQRGEFVTLGQRGNKKKNVYAADGRNLSEDVEPEELRTVGIAHGDVRTAPIDVTENDLRAILHLPERVSYYPHAENVAAHDKAEQEKTNDRQSEKLTELLKQYNQIAGMHFGRITLRYTDRLTDLKDKASQAARFLSELEDDPGAATLKAEIEKTIET